MQDLLPVPIPPDTLNQLRIEVDEVAGEEEVVFWCYGHGVAHEGAGVEG